MKKNISWQVLLIIGLVGAIAGRLIGGVVGDAIGVFGDICLLIGVVNMIVALVKNRKSKKKQEEKLIERPVTKIEVVKGERNSPTNASKEEILRHKFPNIFWDNPDKIADWYDWLRLEPLGRSQKFFSITGKVPNNNEEYEVEIYWYVLADKLKECIIENKKILNKIEQLEMISNDFWKRSLKISKLTNEESLFILHETWEEISEDASIDIELPSENKLGVGIYKYLLKNYLEKYKK